MCFILCLRLLYSSLGLTSTQEKKLPKLAIDFPIRFIHLHPCVVDVVVQSPWHLMFFAAHMVMMLRHIIVSKWQ